MNYSDSFKSMQIPPNTYEVNTIHRDDQNIVSGNIEKRLIIDSRDRNYKNYPKSSNYIIKLNEQFRNITSIELTRAQIPQSGYTINNNNNIINLVESIKLNTVTFCYTLEVKIGDYTIQELVNQLNVLFCSNQSNQLNHKYKVVYDKCTGKVTIKSSGSFELNFKGSVHLDNTHAGFKRLYPPNSIGKLLGFNPEQYGVENNNGTITSISSSTARPIKLCCCLAFTHITPAPIYKITGTNTKFMTTFKICDYLYIYDNNDIEYIFLIVAIRDDQTLDGVYLKPDPIDTCHCDPTCYIPGKSPFSGNTLRSPYIKKGITAPNKYDLFYNRYLVLHIKELERLRSKETSVMDSFAILPLNDKSNSLINVDASKYPTSKEIKYFTPPLGKLDRLTIQFLTYDGYEYDFNGLEHYLDLRINMLNQQGKYLNL